jgi:hypothetical protein
VLRVGVSRVPGSRVTHVTCVLTLVKLEHEQLVQADDNSEHA